MAEEAKAEEATEDLPAEAGPPKLPLILGAVNTLFVLATAGMLVYTRLLFKRPEITEDSERARIEQIKNSPAPPTTTGFVSFEPMTINAAPNVPQDGPSGQVQGKLHYATIGFSLKLSDLSRSGEIDAIKPQILDQFLGLVGRKQFQDLTAIEGRYILKTQLIEVANELARKREKGGSGKDDSAPLVTDLYFNEFIVQ